MSHCNCGCGHYQVYGPIPPDPRQEFTLTQEMVDAAVKFSDEMVRRYIEEGKLPKIV